MGILVCAPIDKDVERYRVVEYIENVTNKDVLEIKVPIISFKKFEDLLIATETASQIKESVFFILKKLLDKERELKGVFEQHFDFTSFIRSFKWNEDDYGKKILPMETLNIFQSEYEGIRTLTDSKITEFNDTKRNFKNLRKKISGNLYEKDLSMITDEPEELEFLKYIFSVIPKSEKVNFTKFINQSEYIVSDGCEVVDEDEEYIVMKLLILKSKNEEVEKKITEQKYIIKKREYSSKEELEVLDRSFEKNFLIIKQNLSVFLDANIMETLNLYIHAEILKLATENILKYGLYDETIYFYIFDENKNVYRLDKITNKWPFSSKKDFRKVKTDEKVFFSFLDYYSFLK